MEFERKISFDFKVTVTQIQYKFRQPVEKPRIILTIICQANLHLCNVMISYTLCLACKHFFLYPSYRNLA